jgi:hypothetical protein
MSSLLLFLSQ